VAGAKPLAVWRLIQTSVRKRGRNITAPPSVFVPLLATSFDVRSFRPVQRDPVCFPFGNWAPFDRRRHSDEQAGFQPTRFSLRLAFRTLAWEIPNCRAIRDDVMPALNAA
jgi:hypothetical protein